MAYFAPYIDASGFHIPTYQDVEGYLVDKAKTNYGTDIYLGPDSQDFQDITVRARLTYDGFLTAQLAYNNRGPKTAIGTGLDGVIALNGLKRERASYSTVDLTITGTAFTVIANGIAGDVNGKAWALPVSVTIGGGGTVTVTAICTEIGAITATAGQINGIVTPTNGWVSVTNAFSATAGQPIETDGEVRARQAVSVANPSQALTDGILGGVLAVANVADAQLYENDTSAPVTEINGATNPAGFPAHSITLVVNGGDGETIASAISYRKTPGAYTDGDQVYIVIGVYGTPKTIRFYRPVAQPMDVAFSITALTGYSSAVGLAARQAITDYLNGLITGQSVVLSELWQAATSVNTDPKQPFFSLRALTAAKDGDSLTTADIHLDFNEKATSLLSDVALTIL